MTAISYRKSSSFAGSVSVSSRHKLCSVHRSMSKIDSFFKFRNVVDQLYLPIYRNKLQNFYRGQPLGNFSTF